MIKKFLKDNIIVFIYMFFAVALELIAQLFVDAKPYFSNFYISMLLFLTLFCLLLSLKGIRRKRITALIFLIAQIIIIVAGVFLYASNGAAFQKEMIYQRNDAFGTIEQFNVDILFIITCLIFLSVFIVFYKIDKKAYSEKSPASTASKKVRVTALVVSIACALSFSTLPVISGVIEKRQPVYNYKLTSSRGDGNQMRGITSNVLYELLKFGSSSGIKTDDIDELEEFLYQQPLEVSRYNGVSKDNNLLFILVESFDTHVLERYSKEDTARLFPNIVRLMDEGVYANNFRQKEKTDTSEVLSLLGSYPTKKYVNYSYEKNAYPYALPNLYRDMAAESGKTAQVLSFHQNAASFYNRDVLHKSLGFDKLYGIDEMLSYGMVNDWDRPGRLTKGERSLDSLTAQVMKDVMIPTNQQFFSYWITYTMHGFYEERENLKNQGYYQLLDEYGLFPKGNDDENHYRTYAASVMDFDKALGILLADLEQKELLSGTTIVLMSDHNTYYNSLTEYAKNLTNNLDPEGFRIPLIIYDEKLTALMEENGDSKVIEKFATTTDVIPTLCDMFGIKGWKNMYLGNTIFGETESIVFSRIYNFFFNDKLAFYSIDDLRYKAPDFTDKDLEDFKIRADYHLKKLYYMDKVYFSDYFFEHEYKTP